MNKLTLQQQLILWAKSNHKPWLFTFEPVTYDSNHKPWLFTFEPVTYDSKLSYNREIEECRRNVICTNNSRKRSYCKG